MKATVTALFTALLLSLPTMAPVPAFAQTQHEASLTMLQGIPDLRGTADVYINGMFRFSLDFRDSQGSLLLTEDSYLIEVRLQSGMILSKKALLEAGKNYTAITHLTHMDGDEAGMKLSLFENTVQRIDPRMSRLDIRHTADAPALDIELSSNADDSRFFVRRVNVTNEHDSMPEAFGESEFGVPFILMDLIPTDESRPLFNRQIHTPLQMETYHLLYLVGSTTDETIDVLVQKIRIPVDRPTR